MTSSTPPDPARPRQLDRWVTGWVVLPDETPLAHRPDPDDLARFMCRRPAEPGCQLLPVRPTHVNECGRCAVAIGRARKKATRAAAGRVPRRRTVIDLEAADRLDRARQRGSSVPTVTGGLPTLGKR